MPRVKLTRLILIIILFICVCLMATNLFIEFRGKSNNNINLHKGLPIETNKNELLVKSITNNDLKQLNFNKNEENINILNNNRYNYELNIRNIDSNLEKPWFMINGTLRPSSRLSTALAIWPEESPIDRIVNQLMYFPKGYDPKDKGLKKIVLYLGRGGWNDLPMGQTKFISDKCPVDRCYLSANSADAAKADAVFFKERFQWPKHKRPANQIWILFLLECPLHTQLFKNLGEGVFNWTATYRHDSDIVAPYEKFVPYYRPGDTKHIQQKNWAEGKTKEVAWFVSNCGARNKRLEYARLLSKYIQVDIYGSCGNKRCPRNKAKQCFEMLNRDYKYYLAFENSNCRDYITEKFFVNGLGHNSLEYNLIPIVMGAHPNDYLRSSPHRSYIHVDDFESPKHLAQYLNLLSANPDLYNKYFEWKSSGEFINTYFWCRVCALLHAEHPKPSHKYTDVSKWWVPKDVCNNGVQKWPKESRN